MNNDEYAYEAALDLVNAINLYESGELDESETTELFQYLVDTGIAWQLQGSYGRTAAALIQSGRVVVSEERSEKAHRS